MYSVENKVSPPDILLVDDTPANLNVLSTMLREEGYKVRAVTNGKMALKAVETIPPDLILLDIKMPNMNGYEVCQKLKSLPFSREIPIIFLSALDEAMDKVKAFEVGGVDYITKPFQFQEVLIRVKNQLNFKAAKIQIERLNQNLETKIKQRTAELEKEIVEHKQTQKRLLHMAYHDDLTDLPNRAFFLNHLKKAIQRGKQESDYLFAVLFLDFDRFKIVNDSLGHLMGDKLLIEISKRLKKILRPNDLIARLGGDEFIILLEKLKNPHDAITIAEKIHQDLSFAIVIDQEHQVYINTSIGIVLSRGDYDNPQDILRDVDTAMYQAKALGSARYQVFKPEMHKKVQKTLQLETDLREALRLDHFIVHYQPIICLATNNLKGFEALVRWQPPGKKMISPGIFIPVAEETGLIFELGMKVLSKACHQLKIWQSDEDFGDSLQSLTMSVNLSVKQFSQPNIVFCIEKILDETNINPSSLNLEITESAIMDNAQLAKKILQDLKERDICLSLDDFGTGYSSLSCLHQFPIDILKVDRSFIARMDRKDENLEIVRAIITLAHLLKIQVVAEGIEEEDQIQRLKELECEFGQGYFIAKPLDSEKAWEFIKDYHMKNII